jgi:ketosteroid isomerase-like protein
MSMSVEELAMAYHQAWTDLDPVVIAALHSEDSVFHMHGIGDPASGRGDIRRMIGSLLTLVPDLHFEIKRLYAGADHFALEYDMSGTFDGKDFTCDGADIIAVADGLVTRKDTCLDVVALIDQVGPLPVIGAAV